MDHTILIIFRPEDLSMDCFTAKYDNWEEIIKSCQPSAKTGQELTRQEALDVLATAQECIDVFDFSQLTVDEMLLAFRGDACKPGQRQAEANKLLLELNFLDFPHIDIGLPTLDRDTTIVVNSITLNRPSNSEPNQWDVTAVYPDTSQSFDLGFIDLPDILALRKTLISLTWIDKQIGYYPSHDLFIRSVEKITTPYTSMGTA